jgi:hypothetical protein
MFRVLSVPIISSTTCVTIGRELSGKIRLKSVRNRAVSHISMVELELSPNLLTHRAPHRI